MPKYVRPFSLMIAALLVLTPGPGAPITASATSYGVAGSTTYLYFRLFPAEPWAYQVLDETAIEHKAIGSAIYVILTPSQASNLYQRVNGLVESEGGFVSFEQIPKIAYEHPELYPQGIYRPPASAPGIATHAIESQVTAIVIDNTTYGSLSARLQTYIADVTAHFLDVTLQVYHPSSADLETAEDVRAFLQQIQQTDEVNGAILVGHIPYASWELPWGEVTSLSLFYEDLDGVFLDQDSDGLYDYHDWGPNEGLEMWISWIRPPTANPIDFLQNYFDKVHDYYENDDLNYNRAWLTINRDWCGAQDGVLGGAFQQAYGDHWDFLGCGTPDAYLLEYTNKWTNNDYQLQNLWAHSSNTGHQFDWDDSQPPGWWLSAQELGALPRGPQMSIMWSCSAMSLVGQPDSNLSTWYIMGDNNGMSALGVSRGIGTPFQEYLIANIHQAGSFAELLFDYLNMVTDREYILSIYPDELHTFVWDIIFVGNPYLFKTEVHTIYLPLVLRSYAPPTGESKIAFVSDRDGNLEIYTMNVNGTGLTRLTDNGANDEGPSWSPDGSRIVFHSNRDGNTQIYVMNADGSNEARLLTSTGSDGWPYWSPDGTKIAFSRWADHSGTGDYCTEVYVMDADGTNVTRLTHSSTLGEGAGAWPSGWSPDGSQILLYWYREGYDQLWLMNSDGSNQRKLATDTYWNAIPTMSPDGTRIAFSSYRDGDYEIYIMNSDGTNQTRLTYTPGQDWRPTWSEDGSKILFESNRDGRTQVYWMNPDGSQQARLTSNTAYDGQATWRPSGQ